MSELRVSLPGSPPWPVARFLQSPCSGHLGPQVQPPSPRTAPFLPSSVSLDPPTPASPPFGFWTFVNHAFIKPHPAPHHKRECACTSCRSPAGPCPWRALKVKLIQSWEVRMPGLSYSIPCSQLPFPPAGISSTGLGLSEVILVHKTVQMQVFFLCHPPALIHQQ